MAIACIMLVRWQLLAVRTWLSTSIALPALSCIPMLISILHIPLIEQQHNKGEFKSSENAFAMCLCDAALIDCSHQLSFCC